MADRIQTKWPSSRAILGTWVGRREIYFQNVLNLINYLPKLFYLILDSTLVLLRENTFSAHFNGLKQYILHSFSFIAFG